MNRTFSRAFFFSNTDISRDEPLSTRLGSTRTRVCFVLSRTGATRKHEEDGFSGTDMAFYFVQEKVGRAAGTKTIGRGGPRAAVDQWDRFHPSADVSPAFSVREPLGL